MNIVDANVLLYAVNEASEHHGAARRWLDDALSGGAIVGFSWVAILAFLRIVTKRPLLPQALSVSEATDRVDDWLAQPPARLVEPTDRHLALVGSLLSTLGTAGDLVADAHLAALAIEHGGAVVSFDTDFALFQGVRWHRPGL